MQIPYQEIKKNTLKSPTYRKTRCKGSDQLCCTKLLMGPLQPPKGVPLKPFFSLSVCHHE